MGKIKKIFLTIKKWFISNGFEGILGLILGVFLFLFGHKFWAGISLGVFTTRNWDIIKKFILSKVRSGDEK